MGGGTVSPGLAPAAAWSGLDPKPQVPQPEDEPCHCMSEAWGRRRWRELGQWKMVSEPRARDCCHAARAQSPLARAPQPEPNSTAHRNMGNSLAAYSSTRLCTSFPQNHHPGGCDHKKSRWCREALVVLTKMFKKEIKHLEIASLVFTTLS